MKDAWYQFSLNFGARMNIFWQHYWKNKKSLSIACTPKLAFAAIMESEK